VDGPAPNATVPRGRLLIDCEEDRTLRPVLVGMLREDDRGHRAIGNPAARRAGDLIPQLRRCLSRWVSRQPATLLPMAHGRYRSAVAGRHYDDIDPNVLRALPNPGGAMELKHKAPEVTFLGAHDQPDFGTLYVTFYPGEKVIELKSLKEYLYQWRNTAVSYERFLDVVYDHLMRVYEPVRLRLVFETRPRGGISSKLTIDSDWSIRGGKEQFRDWGGPDTW